jgi:hypothetical protein
MNCTFYRQAQGKGAISDKMSTSLQIYSRTLNVSLWLNRPVSYIEILAFANSDFKIFHFSLWFTQITLPLNYFYLIPEREDKQRFSYIRTLRVLEEQFVLRRGKITGNIPFRKVNAGIRTTAYVPLEFSRTTDYFLQLPHMRIVKLTYYMGTE